MKLSTKARYATRMLLDLASSPRSVPVQTKDISKRQGISQKYLEQLAVLLKKANILISIRGPRGGHILAKKPEEITIGEIVRAVEGERALTDCVLSPESCDRSEECMAKKVWMKATEALYKELDSITLSHLLCKDKEDCK